MALQSPWLFGADFVATQPNPWRLLGQYVGELITKRIISLHIMRSGHRRFAAGNRTLSLARDILSEMEEIGTAAVPAARALGRVIEWFP
mmetsp:Transcript_43255/g.97732  ORF Transcript_43255/g.97732 Transcript_43255/m.97732 type:complete len:89 (-) Transcript_43255:381-647(-)